MENRERRIGEKEERERRNDRQQFPTQSKEKDTAKATYLRRRRMSSSVYYDVTRTISVILFIHRYVSARDVAGIALSAFATVARDASSSSTSARLYRILPLFLFLVKLRSFPSSLSFLFPSILYNDACKKDIQGKKCIYRFRLSPRMILSHSIFREGKSCFSF